MSSLDLDRLDSWVARLLLGAEDRVARPLLGAEDRVKFEMRAVLDADDISRLEGICPLAREMMEAWSGTEEVRKTFLWWLRAAQVLEAYKRLCGRFQKVAAARPDPYCRATGYLFIHDGLSYSDLSEPQERPIQVVVCVSFPVRGLALSFMVKPQASRGHGYASNLPWPEDDKETTWEAWEEGMVGLIRQAPQVAWERHGVRICPSCGHEYFQEMDCYMCEKMGS